MAALRGAETIVLDGSALATLFVCQAYQSLKNLRLKIAISYGTLRGLKRLYIERVNSGGQGFLTKVGDRFVFREENVEEREQYLEQMREFIEILEAVAAIEEGRPFSTIEKSARDAIETCFGRACGESIALAQRDNRVLWLDDLPVAQLAATDLRVKCVWTQAVMCHEYDEGRLDGDLFYGICLKLLRYRYTSTRVVPGIVLFAGNKADWSTADPDLAVVLSWFGNSNISPTTLAWMTSNVIAQVLIVVREQDRADNVILTVLREIAGRHDGKTLLGQLRDSIDKNWADAQIDKERLKTLINQVVT